MSQIRVRYWDKKQKETRVWERERNKSVLAAVYGSKNGPHVDKDTWFFESQQRTVY